MRRSRKPWGDLLRTTVILGLFLTMPTAAFANDPPELTLPWVEGEVYEETAPLDFTATATDPDVPTVFTFGLTGAPPGATIDPATGEFSWTPTPAQYPGTYVFSVWVSDNGVPSQTDSQVITVEAVGDPFPMGYPKPKYICVGPDGSCRCKHTGKSNQWCNKSGDDCSGSNGGDPDQMTSCQGPG